jgi:RNA polymerase sigma-70 factor (ECF subfamily)
VSERDGEAPDDAAGIRGILEGDATALEAARRVVQAVARYGGYGIPAADRADIVQQTLLDACAALAKPDFRLRHSLGRLLRTLAHRRCVDWVRRRRPTDPIGDDLVDPDRGAEAHLLDNERRRLATWIVGELDPPCRELIRLHVYENLSYAEIAARTGRSPGALRVEMCTCLKKARALLERSRTLKNPGAGGAGGGR